MAVKIFMGTGIRYINDKSEITKHFEKKMNEHQRRAKERKFFKNSPRFSEIKK